MNGEPDKVSDNETAVYTTYSSTVVSYNASLLETKNVEITDFTSVVTCNLSLTSSVIITAPEVSSTSLLLLQKYSLQDQNIEKTFNYYWDKYPDLFGKIQIVYTDVDSSGNQITRPLRIIINNKNYLNEYYNKGYRLFIGFGSDTLAALLPWFTKVGTQAKGISLNSSASFLNFPKPVYRLQVDDNKNIDSLNSILTNASKIYYIYSELQLTAKDFLSYLESLYPGRIIPYLVKTDSSNLTLENIKNLYKDADNDSVSIMYLNKGTQQSDFVNVFNDSYPMPTPTYDIILTGYPVIKETSKNALINKYNYLANISFSTAVLFREGLNSLKELFSTYVPNALLLINALAINVDITTLPADNSILEFNENNDIKYYTFLNSIYSKNDKGEYYYKTEFYLVYDPIVGRQTFYVNPPL